MPRYSWEGRTANGSLVRAELEAPSRDAAAQSLRSRGITVTRVEEVAGSMTASAAEPGPPPPPRGGRPREPLRDKLFTFGVPLFFAALGVGAAWIDPVLFYDCARQANGSVDCTVHRRMYGVIPRGDIRISRITSVDVRSGVHSETMAERSRRLRIGGSESSYEVLLLASADGTRWQSPESSWPMGRTVSDHRQGIQELLDATSPGTYRGWTAEKVTLTIALVFWAPVGFILLGLVLRLLIPRSITNEQVVAALQGVASRLRQMPK